MQSYSVRGSHLSPRVTLTSCRERRWSFSTFQACEQQWRVPLKFDRTSSQCRFISQHRRVSSSRIFFFFFPPRGESRPLNSLAFSCDRADDSSPQVWSSFLVYFLNWNDDMTKVVYSFIIFMLFCLKCGTWSKQGFKSYICVLYVRNFRANVSVSDTCSMIGTRPLQSW